ncbi:hypothetical protein GCM10022280_04150 [Sphingomonas swuensis]|uniref:Beta-carotene 15,15'-monooxygenase n=1 Tax=Sphingomonas swuensis TaxID=977800 RepID=A0ABP7SD64_9SPHN
MRNAAFDGLFLYGIFFMAVATGLVVMVEPRLFYPILAIDLWLLGYHHVIATYTRLFFDKESYREHRLLIVALFPAVVAITGLIAWKVGLWAIVTIYFYWQWWHYTRQSWGVSRVYRAKDRGAAYDDGWLDQAIFYALPVLGILHRSNQKQPNFIGLEVAYVPVADIVVQVAAAAAAVLVAIWIWRRIQAAREGRLALLHTAYMVIHFSIFWIGYVAIDDISVGWLVVNMWHNAQYILFVWMFNNRRFNKGVDPASPLLSYISQNGRLWMYLASCLAITAVIYWGLIRSIDWLFFAGLSATIVIFQIINFHHYVVDSLIWKVRKAPLQKTLGLSS